MLTQAEVESALPPHLKGYADQELVDRLNTIVADPEFADQVRENFIGYAGVLREGRYKISDYISAVQFVSHRLMNHTVTESYIRTFPNRYQDMLANGKNTAYIASVAGAYNRGQLVTAIMKQTVTPSWVLNQDIYQKAINVQYELMTTANSEKVRQDAADSLLTHLKPPEAKEINLNLGVQEASGLAELKNSMAEMAQMQRKLIEEGVDTRLIAAQPIIQGEFVTVDPD